MKKTGILLFSLLSLFTFCTKETDAVTGPYFPKVKSIIANHCLTCHSSSGSWEGRPTEFDTDEQITVAYSSIKAAVADPVTQFNKRMPQTGMLTSSEIEIIVKWWGQGGKITD